MAEPSQFELLKWGISIGVPALSGLVGVVVGAILTNKREGIRRKYEFIKRQLENLYSPLLAIRRNLKATGELRLQISNTANIEWQKLCKRYGGQPDELRNLSETRGKAFEKIIDYNNEKLITEDLPAYHNMIAIIKKNMWLAEASTIEHFPKLIVFVDLWERFLADTLPGEVVKAIGHTEKSLYPLYDDLQKQHDRLRAKLSSGKI